MTYPGPETDIGKRRMTEDANMVSNYAGWPDAVLHLKEQPWVKANGRRFGIITLEDRLKNLYRVRVKDSDEVEEFGSIAEMVETWSVD